MTDKILALVALAALIGFLGTLVVFVPDPDLTIVCIIAMLMAAFDFYRSTFKKPNDEDRNRKA